MPAWLKAGRREQQGLDALAAAEGRYRSEGEWRNLIAKIRVAPGATGRQGTFVLQGTQLLTRDNAGRWYAHRVEAGEYGEEKEAEAEVPLAAPTPKPAVQLGFPSMLVVVNPPREAAPSEPPLATNKRTMPPLRSLPSPQGASRAPTFFATLQQLRLKAIPEVMDEPNRPVGFDGWVEKTLLSVQAHYSVDERTAGEMVVASYSLFLNDPFWRARNCPMRAFIKPEQWRRFIQEVASRRAGGSAAEQLREVWNSIVEPSEREPARLARWVTPDLQEVHLAAQGLRARPLAQWRALFQRAAASARLCGGMPSGWRVTPRWLLEEANAQQVLAGAWDDPGFKPKVRCQVTCCAPGCHKEARGGWDAGPGHPTENTGLCLGHGDDFEAWREREQMPPAENEEQMAQEVQAWCTTSTEPSSAVAV